MNIPEKSNLIIYRIGEKGLEVFLVNAGEVQDQWTIPQGTIDQLPDFEADMVIELDPVEQEDGLFEQAYAVEGDWHNIPSMKSILKHDMAFMKHTLKKMVPDMMSKGTFFAVKEAFKKVMPHQYKMLKELKEIIIDRNLTKYI